MYWRGFRSKLGTVISYRLFNMPTIFIVIILISGNGYIGVAAQSTYDAVLAGKKCKVAEHNQLLECEYRVGSGLFFTISGIGAPDAAITFMRSSYEGDFYATTTVPDIRNLHDCVIIKPGLKNKLGLLSPGAFAFVSPYNGKVYKTWEECKGGM